MISYGWLWNWIWPHVYELPDRLLVRVSSCYSKVWRSNAITIVAFLTLWCDCMIVVGTFLMNSKHWQKLSNMCNMWPEEWHFCSIGEFDNLLLFEQNFYFGPIVWCCLPWGLLFYISLQFTIFKSYTFWRAEDLYVKGFLKMLVVSTGEWKLSCCHQR